MQCGRNAEGIMLVKVVGIVSTEVSRVTIKPITLQKVTMHITETKIVTAKATIILKVQGIQMFSKVT